MAFFSYLDENSNITDVTFNDRPRLGPLDKAFQAKIIEIVLWKFKEGVKNLIIYLIIMTTVSCNQADTNKSNMEQAKIIEIVLWKFKDGVKIEQGKESVFKLNDFVSKQPGFISRKTATSEDGKFLDVVVWTDLESAQAASEKAMQNEMTTTIFSTMDEDEMLFQYFEIFNKIEK